MGGFMDRLMQPEVLRAVQRLKPIAEEAGLTLPQFALAWVLREPNVASAIIGASRPEQVRENARASGVIVDTQLFLRAEAIIDEALRASRNRLDRLRAAPRRRDENLLDRQVEQLGDAEGERQRGIVFAGLDRVDALARHFEPLGQVLLAPVALGAEHAEAVFHQQPPAPSVSLLTIAADAEPEEPRSR